MVLGEKVGSSMEVSNALDCKRNGHDNGSKLQIGNGTENQKEATKRDKETKNLTIRDVERLTERLATIGSNGGVVKETVKRGSNSQQQNVGGTKNMENVCNTNLTDRGSDM